MCAVHAIRGCDSAVIITRGTLRGTTKCLRVLNNEEINKKPERRGVSLANARLRAAHSLSKQEARARAQGEAQSRFASV